MKRSPFGAGVLAACLLLTGCQTIPGSEVLEKDPWAGTHFTAAPVPVPGLAARIAAVSGDPLDAIPARMNFAPTPDSWTFEFAQKLLDVAMATRGKDHIGTTDPVTLATYFTIIGRPDRVAEVEKSLEGGFLEKPGDLDAECREPVGQVDPCGNEARRHLIAASLAYLRGDVQGAERRFRATERYAAQIRNNRPALTYDTYLRMWYEARVTYQLLAGRHRDAVATYKEWRKFEKDEQTGANWAPTNFRNRLELVRHRGHTRETVALARMIGSDPELGHVLVLDLVMDDLDVALARGGDTQVAKAYLKAAMAFPGYYPKASMVWRNLRALDFECHAGRIAAADGDRKSAAEVLDALLPLYSEMPQDGTFELGYCLYKLADALGSTTHRTALLESMRAKRAVSVERINAAHEVYIAGLHRDGRTGGSISMERQLRVVHKINLVTLPSPQAYAFLQPKLFEDSLIAALEVTKDPDIDQHRGNELGNLFVYALKRYHLAGES